MASNDMKQNTVSNSIYPTDLMGDAKVPLRVVQAHKTTTQKLPEALEMLELVIHAARDGEAMEQFDLDTEAAND